jgi:hypothetical protein
MLESDFALGAIHRRCGRSGRPQFGKELLCRNCYRKDPGHTGNAASAAGTPIEQCAEDGSPLMTDLRATPGAHRCELRRAATRADHSTSSH